MKLVQLLLMIKQMRDSQKEYFHTRSSESLANSKYLEKQVDEIVERGIEYYAKKNLERAAQVLEEHGFERIET